MGIWVITTKSNLPYGLRVSVGVGFAAAIPFMINTWMMIWVERDDWPINIAKPATGTFAACPLIILVGCGY